MKIDLRGWELIVVAVAWLAGILLNSWLALPALPLLIVASSVLIGLPLAWRDRQGRLAFLFILWLVLGAWRYSIASPAGDPHALPAFIGKGKVDIRGVVADEPTLEARSRLLLIDASSISTDGGTSWQDAHGQLEAQMLGGEIDNPYGPNYGDSVELQGKLQPPPPHSTPEVLASMPFPRISVSSAGGNPVLVALFQLRLRLATIILQALPQPEAALMLAILLGMHTPALKPLISAFNETGTAHISAASGFKVTIVAGIVTTCTRWLYEKRKQPAIRLLPAEKSRGQWRRWVATGTTIGSIGIYTILCGASPAALRAGIMGALLVVAPRLGRVYNIYTALAATAIVMSVFDPFVLWDAGFQLSFLGTLGIVLLTPLFQYLLKPLERLPLGYYIAEISAVTLAAQAATLPITALTFNQISFIAPVVNILTVPVLAPTIFLGFLLCAAGSLYLPLAIFCGWVARPLLWYTLNIITWCSELPWAFITVNNPSAGLACCYYGILALVISIIFYKWPAVNPLNNPAGHTLPYTAHTPSLRSRRRWRMMQLGAALLVILATGATALASRPDGRLTISFLSVGPAGQPPQGEAILIHTPDGKYALIDGGMDATSLDLELDSRLPSWQRSLDVVMLTSPRTDHLAGLQDVVTRYQIGEVLDAGVLHPGTNYALWRRMINENGIHYVQVRQGMTVSIGMEVALQVLWPPSQLHKGSSEELDNGLIVRLLAPGLRLLLLGAASMSKFALSGIVNSISSSYLQADIVQLVAEAGKNFPSELSAVLQAAHPSVLVITPAALTPKQRKAHMTSIVSTLPQALASPSWQVVQTAQAGTLEITGSNQGWTMNV